MASVIPSVLLALSVVAVVLAILGGITQYYASIYAQPEILPAYGTVYVKNVNETTGMITIVNQFGYPVRALFTVRTTNVRNPLFTTCSFWVTLLPGTNYVDVLKKARSECGPSVSVDLTSSYFLLGNTKFPLRKGAGALPPATKSANTASVYRVRGLGAKDFDDGKGHVTIFFKGGYFKLLYSSVNRFGYFRDITGYRTVTRYAERHIGHACSYTTVTKTGKEYETYSCINETCYENCKSNGGSDNDCIEKCETTCEGCVTCTKTVTKGSSKSIDYYSNKKTFGCAKKGIQLYWSPGINMSVDTTFPTGALLGFTQFTKKFAIDMGKYFMRNPTFKSVNAIWPYFLKPAKCLYNFSIIKHSTTLTETTAWICDKRCGSAFKYTACKESSWVASTEERQACPAGTICASKAKFLIGIPSTGSLNVTVYLTSMNRIVADMNLTYTVIYARNGTDKELKDTHMHFKAVNTITLQLPELAGYVSIPYTDALKKVEVILQPKVTYVATIKTEDGVRTASFTVVAKKMVFRASLTPTGYVAVSSPGMASSKTYFFEVGNPYITVKLESPDIGFLLPLKKGDVVTVTIRMTISFTPEVDIETEVGP